MAVLERSGIQIEELSTEEAVAHRKKWVTSFVPPDKWRDAEELCIRNTQGHSVFLWQAFSYGLVDHLESDFAKNEFDIVDKDTEVIFLIDGNDIAFMLSNIISMSPEDVDLLVEANFTDIHYSWTYAKTHEDDWIGGPYFLHR